MSVDYSYEREAFAAGYRAVCGVDEAGAGPLCGPVYAAAVILPEGCAVEGLNDSKQLPAKKREALFDAIRKAAAAYAVAFATEREIDGTDILSARMLAMQRAIDALGVAADFALIDGNRDRGRSAAIETPHRCIVKGDSLSMSIAAASILAKVSRDRFMTDVLDKRYPEYGFAQHKGYGTKLHYAMLDRYGPCEAHRKSFLRKWEARR